MDRFSVPSFCSSVFGQSPLVLCFCTVSLHGPRAPGFIIICGLLVCAVCTCFISLLFLKLVSFQYCPAFYPLCPLLKTSARITTRPYSGVLSGLDGVILTSFLTRLSNILLSPHLESGSLPSSGKFSIHDLKAYPRNCPQLVHNVSTLVLQPVKTCRKGEEKAAESEKISR